jgi:hypothetical protein
MLDEFSSEIRSSQMSEDEKTYHLECVGLVKAAFSPARISVNWDQFRNGISEGLLTRLQGAEVALRRYVSEVVLTNDDFKDVRMSIEKAIEVVRNSDLPDEVKTFLTKHLVKMQIALLEYDFLGLDAFRDAVTSYLGSLATTSATIDEHATKEQKQTLANVLASANSLFSLAKSAAWAWPHLHAGLTVLAGLLGG